MTDTFKPTPADTYSGSTYGNAAQDRTSYEPTDENAPDVGKALLIGVLGGILSAAGYLVYQRLPDEHKQRLQSQAKTALQQRLSELRNNFNI